MKKVLLLALIPLAAFAAAPVVTITDTGNCIVDGLNVGAPADAIDNNPALAPAIQKALVAYVAKVSADAATATKAAQDAAAAQAAAAKAEADKASAEAIAANAKELADLKAALAARDAEIAALKKQLTDAATPAKEDPPATP